jgi:DNA invertase Pin-like site-specific DNA recombinase
MNTPAPATAFSYLRFSSPEQAKGDSIRRQTAARDTWLAAHPHVTLDSSLKPDEGRSAFNRDAESFATYALGQFVERVKAGKVPPGSYLLVENLDRLSREDEGTATELLLSIVNRGVIVVQLLPETVEFRKPVNMMSLMRAVIELTRAHGESLRKSDSVGRAWRNKLGNAKQKALTRRVPVWIRTVGGEGKEIKHTAPGEVRFELDEGKAAVVQRIFAEAIDGAGALAIAKKLNAESVPYIGRPTVKGKAVAWNRTLVYQILTSSACIGMFTPYRCRSKGRKSQSAGTPVQNYFPPVVDDTTFYRAQKALETRAKVGRGRRGKHVNLLAGLLVDARSGGPMTYSNRAHNPIVIPQNAVERGDAKWVCFSAHCLERAILAKLKELRAKDVTDGTSAAAKRVKDAEANVERLDELRTAWKAKMNDLRIVNVVSEKLAEIEADRERAVREHEEAQREFATPAGDAIDEIRTLADLLERDNSDDTRLKVRAVLRAAVESVTLLVLCAKRGTRTRKAAAQVRFRGGAVRSYVIVTRHPRRQTKPTWDALSMDTVTDPRAGAIDLRTPRGMKLVERLLSELD